MDRTPAHRTPYKEGGSRRLVRAGAFSLGIACAVTANERPARAQSTNAAPSLALAALHRQATEELHAFVGRLSPEARQKLTGVYVAFDTSVTDIGSMAACDDDGDYVVVLSDALLGLADFVAQAEATDEIFWTHKLDEYATFLAESQRSGTRTPPPPPGFFDAAQAHAIRKMEVEAARFREMVAAIVAHELAHLLQGDLVCPRPTATHEGGDDEWTREERDHALSVALKLYTTARVFAADTAGVDLLLESGMTEQGDLAWLSTQDRIERAARERTDRPAPSTYLRLHEACSVRAEVVRAAANRWRQLRFPAAAANAKAALSPSMSANQ
jgi:hypothetical protein